MIDRYSRKEMNNIWSSENRFTKMLEVELAVLKAYVKKGIIPENDYQAIKSHGCIDVKRIAEIEKETKHDVIAFTKAVCEKMGPEKRWFHFGLTSTDVVDTAQSLQLKEVNQIIKEDLKSMLEVLKKQALKYQKTLCIGRTHGMHAEVTSFGLKWLLWYDELERCAKRFDEECKNIEVVKISGAVGNYADISPIIEEEVAKELKMAKASIATQVLSRDRHIGYMNSIAMIASALEKIAMEVRHLSRSEIGEVSEAFSVGQKGSSAMPHKKNPISSENICGCARVVKSYLNVAYENNPLWDERDISHSSAERIVLVDATTLIDYMLNRYAGVLENLQVNENRMKQNIELSNGVVYSSRLLLFLVNKGMLREEAYDLLQKAAFEALNNKKSFVQCVLESPLKQKLTEEEIARCLDTEVILSNVETIYQNVLGQNYNTGKAVVVLGSGWGDEGKGKITNYLSEQSDYVVRFQGGDNAGHTIKFDGVTYKLHLIPSGIFNNQIKNIMGNGMVINPESLVNELATIKEHGFKCQNLYISDRAHVIFDYHKEMDKCLENALANRKIGTTLKGIGPAYTDKVSRQGMRMTDFVSDDFERLYRMNATIKNEEIKNLGGMPIDIDASVEKYKKIAQEIKPLVVDTIEMIHDGYASGKKILFEGAQGSLLDIDFGTYPFVTSSNPTSGGVCTGSGFGPTRIDEIIGIVKAYSTRVGSGAFPTEMENTEDEELGKDIRELAGEYGATTHRARRIGWLDGVALKYSTNINGFTGISLMLLDILSGIKKIKICVAYRLNGKIIKTLPANLTDFENCQPIYEEYDGWMEDISNVTSFEELPINAQKYIEAIEKLIGVPVKIFSVGPDKKQTIIREEIY